MHELNNQQLPIISFGCMSTGNGENAGKGHFLPFQQYFLPCPIKLQFYNIINFVVCKCFHSGLEFCNLK